MKTFEEKMWNKKFTHILAIKTIKTHQKQLQGNHKNEEKNLHKINEADQKGKKVYSKSNNVQQEIGNF